MSDYVCYLLVTGTVVPVTVDRIGELCVSAIWDEVDSEVYDKDPLHMTLGCRTTAVRLSEGLLLLILRILYSLSTN